MIWNRLPLLAITLFIIGFILHACSGIRPKHDIPLLAVVAAGIMAAAAALLPLTLVARDFAARKANRSSKTPPA
jgi:hypothetical protein